MTEKHDSGQVGECKVPSTSSALCCACGLGFTMSRLPPLSAPLRALIAVKCRYRAVGSGRYRRYGPVCSAGTVMCASYRCGTAPVQREHR
jgi:hypothetical protein